jgi:DNA-binding CsgD family transcriptional regulator
MGNREISERLFISKRTAENHLARIYDKFGITSRVELVRLLERPGLG